MEEQLSWFSPPITELDKAVYRIVMLITGEFGAGKTYTGCQFPNSVFFDIEKGNTFSQYQQQLAKSGSFSYRTDDIDDIISKLKDLYKKKHKYSTVIFDTITALNNNLTNEIYIKYGLANTGAYYKEVQSKIKEFYSALMKLDMNIIYLAHSKTIRAAYRRSQVKYFTPENTRDDLVPDVWKGLEGYVDVSLELQGQVEESGQKFYQVYISKSRYPNLIQNNKHTFNFSFNELKNRMTNIDFISPANHKNSIASFKKSLDSKGLNITAARTTPYSDNELNKMNTKSNVIKPIYNNLKETEIKSVHIPITEKQLKMLQVKKRILISNPKFEFGEYEYKQLLKQFNVEHANDLSKVAATQVIDLLVKLEESKN